MLRHALRQLVHELHTGQPAFVELGDHVEPALELLALPGEILDRLDLGPQLLPLVRSYRALLRQQAQDKPLHIVVKTRKAYGKS